VAAVVVVALAAAAAMVVFVVTHLWLVIGGLVVVAAGAYGFQRVLLRHTVLVSAVLRSPRARAALPAPEPVRAVSAPLAIEARHVVPGVVIGSEISERR
jgi:hypothetical protein